MACHETNARRAAKIRKEEEEAIVLGFWFRFSYVAACVFEGSRCFENAGDGCLYSCSK
jgi:hypothetical protein